MNFQNSYNNSNYVQEKIFILGRIGQTGMDTLPLRLSMVIGMCGYSRPCLSLAWMVNN